MLEPVPSEPRMLRDLVDVIGVGQAQRVGRIAITLFSVERYANGLRAVAGFVVDDDHPMAIARRAADEARHAAYVQRLAEGEPDQPRTEIRPGDEWIGVAPSIHGWPRWEASDDLGTRYTGWMDGGGGSGDELGVVWRMDVGFRPAVPADARMLTITAPEFVWSELPPGATADRPVHTDPGPWTFPVTLPNGANRTEAS